MDNNNNFNQSESNSSQFPENNASEPIVLGSPRPVENPQIQTQGYTDTNPNSNINGYADVKKKNRKGASRSFVAVAVCLCILFSGILAFGGAYLAITLFDKDGSTGVKGGNKNVTINYVSTKDEDTPVLEEGNIAYVASVVSDSVVEISTETVTTSPYFGQYITEGAGSGVIISTNDSESYIITCAHVVDGASTVKVTLTDGNKYDASIVGIDSQTDIAVVKIDIGNLDAATVGDYDSLVVGQKVVAVGNPLGELGSTVTDGIISALDREIEIEGQTYNLLQTNAAINPGNSGGGLFDIEGNLIGIVNAKSSGTGIEGLGFAIPISDAIEIASQLIKNGYVAGRVKLGFSLIEVTDSTDIYSYWQYKDFITDYGIYIIESESSDFQKGDRIIAIDNNTVSSVADLKNMLQDYEVGDVVTITVSRINKSTRRSEIMQIKLTLKEKTAEE